VGEPERGERQASTRVAELKDKIEQATELIGELRETNYSLSGEVAELRRELEAVSASGAHETSSEASDDGECRAELEALRKERKTIREKVALLIERIEKLES
jgi:chromosome segregation ATPase